MIDRHKFFGAASKVAFALTAAALTPRVTNAAATVSKTRPNIVFILADDLGYGDVHYLNPTRGKIPTPNLDRFAKEGMTFLDAHACSSVCTPSRYGILTGRYPWRTRLQHGVLSGFDEPLIAKDRLTVASLLQQHGYTTACIGKWHLGFTINARAQRKNGLGAPVGARTENGPTTRGFDLFYGYELARMMQSVFENGCCVAHVKPVDMLPTLTQHATDYIATEAKSGHSFFLYFAMSSPHTPLVPTKAWRGKSKLGKYGDFVMETDWAVGQVLKAIDAAGVADNTLVIFSSDNGCAPYINVKRLEKLGHYPSAQFRGFKSDIWDGGNRVPLFIRWPGKIKAGSRSDQLVCLTDFMATCADLLDAKLPKSAAVDSYSILPVLLGKGPGARHSLIDQSIYGMLAIRQGPWKLEFCPGSGGWDAPRDAEARKLGLPPIQLYNMDIDPGEQTNLEAKQTERIKEMTGLIEKYIADGRSTPGPQETNAVPVELFKKGRH